MLPCTRAEETEFTLSKRSSVEQPLSVADGDAEQSQRQQPPKRPDLPNSRNSPDLFPETHWSIVLRAKGDSQIALNTLCTCYRGPLLVYVRLVYVRRDLQSRGQSPEDPEDLVQGFLAHFLQKNALKQVAENKGRFRAFLLTCLKHYLNDQHDKAVAQRRGGGQIHDSLQQTDDEGRLVHDPVAPDPSPDREYDRAWLRTLLARATDRLRAEYESSGQSALFTALEPILQADEPATPYARIAENLQKTEAALKMAAHRLRSRFGNLIRQEIQQTVTNSQEMEEEVQYLLSLSSLK